MLRSPWTMGISSQFRDTTSGIAWSFPIVYPISGSLKAFFSLFWQLTKAKPVYWWQSTIYFTTLPYWIDHGAGPSIPSMLVLVSCPKEHRGVTAVALLQRCRIVARIHYSNMFFYIRKPNQMVTSMINRWRSPWWSTMDFSASTIITIIQTVRYGCIQWSSNDFKQINPAERPRYTSHSRPMPYRCYQRYGLLKC